MERQIDVLTHASLFSGIGGFDLAAEWAGWENIFHCEWNEFGKRVLNFYWPRAACYGDITKTDFTKYRGKIGVLSGGFPCQPYSVAGKRLGKEDERHLWPHMLRAVREIRPRYVVGENVRGLISWNGGLVFDEVQADLEAEGYLVIPVILPASSVNAPHRRERVWFIAYCADARLEGMRCAREVEVHGHGAASDTCFGARDDKPFESSPKQQIEESARICNSRYVNAINTYDERCSEQHLSGEPNEQIKSSGGFNEGYAPNTCSSRRVQNYVERKTEESEYVIPCWDFFPTQPPVCSRNDGLSIKLDGTTFPRWRGESIKAFGNAIVPQVAFEIFKIINELEQTLFYYKDLI